MLRKFCAISSGNWPSGNGEEVVNVEILQTDRQMHRQTDWLTDKKNMWTEKVTWSFSSAELIKSYMVWTSFVWEAKWQKY